MGTLVVKKLAELLLRRKELQEKVDQVRKVKEADLFEVSMTRRQVNETIDDLTARIPKLTLAQVTEEFDFYASRLRQVDALIQRYNWTVDVDTPIEVMQNYVAR